MWIPKDAALIRGKLYFVIFFGKLQRGRRKEIGCSILSVCLRRKFFFGLLVFSFTIYILKYSRNDRNSLKTA